MPKSILLYANLGLKGGIETHVFPISQLLVQHGAQVTIASLSEVNSEWRELEELGIRIVTTGLPYNSHARLKNIFALSSWPLRLPLRSFDAVCGFGSSGFFPFMRAFLSQAGWLIYNEAGNGILPGRVYARMLRAVDGIIAMSPRVVANIKNYAPPSTPVNFLAHLNCPDAKFPDVHVWCKPRDIIRLGYFGRLVEGKNLEMLISLWEDLNIGPAQLTIYGDGPERNHLTDFIQKYDLADEIYLWGLYQNKTDLPVLMAQTDLVVSPSKSEGLPQVLLEAIAHGVPFVATDVGGVADLAEDNPDVMVVPPTREDIKEGIEVMAKRLRKGDISPQRLQRYYKERYSFEVLAPRWIEALLEPQKFFS
jgi:glycosyltransferase involved in cell wall biosynthesis